jgi:GMP reductase
MIYDVVREYNYSNIFLRPKKTIVNSRKDCNVSIILNGYEFDLPIYAANMKSVVNEETCEFLASENMFYTMHRFGIDLLDFIDRMHTENYLASVSIGVNQDTYEQLEILKSKKVYPEFITLDIANAWCEKAKSMVQYVRSNFEKSFLIVGNIATLDAVREVHTWGAQAIKAGIAGGKVCITKNKTGFHRPMASTILECSQYTIPAKLPLIADGGIAEHGDIAKAIACGADLVMAGSLFAGWDESAGNIIEVSVNGEKAHQYKEYFGSASQYNKGEYKNVEGKKMLIDYKGSMKKLLIELKEDLQSAVSYSGGTKLTDLRETVKILV